jgi:hypothetical protein
MEDQLPEVIDPRDAQLAFITKTLLSEGILIAPDSRIIFKRCPAPKVKQQKCKGLREVPPNVKIFYLGRPGKEVSPLLGAKAHDGVMTMAVKIQELYLEFGFAFCSPQDPWCKVIGRDTALVRLGNMPMRVPYLYDPKQMISQVAHAVLAHDLKGLVGYGVIIPKNLSIPTWTKELLKYHAKSLKKMLANLVADIMRL